MKEKRKKVSERREKKQPKNPGILSRTQVDGLNAVFKV